MNLVPLKIPDVRHLFETHHGYKSVGNVATYCFGVEERGWVVAAFVWQPPPPGAAKSVCPEVPGAVLALSRMVAVPKTDRSLKHISKPLKLQMKKTIDRGRWPVLITYSDEGQGHTGYVYQCSGWQPTRRSRRPVYENDDGQRCSSYRNGAHNIDNLTQCDNTYIQRWEHWACPAGQVREHMRAHGWVQQQVPGKFWRSGSPQMRFEQVELGRGARIRP